MGWHAPFRLLVAWVEHGLVSGSIARLEVHGENKLGHLERLHGPDVQELVVATNELFVLAFLILSHGRGTFKVELTKEGVQAVELVNHPAQLSKLGRVLLEVLGDVGRRLLKVLHILDVVGAPLALALREPTIVHIEDAWNAQHLLTELPVGSPRHEEIQGLAVAEARVRDDALELSEVVPLELGELISHVRGPVLHDLVVGFCCLFTEGQSRGVRLTGSGPASVLAPPLTLPSIGVNLAQVPVESIVCIKVGAKSVEVERLGRNGVSTEC